MTLHKISRLLLSGALAMVLSACAGSKDLLRDPVPETLASQSVVPGYPRIRYWGDDATDMEAGALSQMAAQQASRKLSEVSYLSVSGGGSNGAFGAGLLFGWTASGTRPEFTVVTGISTGSLIAPFAFLGPPYDENLKAAYTRISGKDIYEQKGLLEILGSTSAADNSPLRRLVATYVTDRMVSDIAREHAKGRRLLIGTTNLDAERPVVWDIGAIATSQGPNLRQLIQDVLVASASIPGVFPPVNIKVDAGGRYFDEMHVDGGTSKQAFLFPSNLSLKNTDKKLGLKRTRTLYVVRNGKVTPEYSAVRPKLASIAGKSIGSLIKTQGIGDLYRMYANARQEGVDFNAIWIPPSFTAKETSPFDHGYMNQLFQMGYEMGRSGIRWNKRPP